MSDGESNNIQNVLQLWKKREKWRKSAKMNGLKWKLSQTLEGLILQHQKQRCRSLSKLVLIEKQAKWSTKGKLFALFVGWLVFILWHHLLNVNADITICHPWPYLHDIIITSLMSLSCLSHTLHDDHDVIPLWHHYHTTDIITHTLCHYHDIIR